MLEAHEGLITDKLRHLWNYFRARLSSVYALYSCCRFLFWHLCQSSCRVQPSNNDRLPGVYSQICTPTFSLCDPESIFIFPLSFSPLFRWAESSVEPKPSWSVQSRRGAVEIQGEIPSPAVSRREIPLSLWLNTCLSTVNTQLVLTFSLSNDCSAVSVSSYLSIKLLWFGDFLYLVAKQTNKNRSDIEWMHVILIIVGVDRRIKTVGYIL